MKTASSEMLHTLTTEMWSGTAASAKPAESAKSAKPAPQRLSKAAQRRVTRLTLDIADDLHRRMKRDCADQGLKMCDVLREFIEMRFPA